MDLRYYIIYKIFFRKITPSLPPSFEKWDRSDQSSKKKIDTFQTNGIEEWFPKGNLQWDNGACKFAKSKKMDKSVGKRYESSDR